MFRFLRSEKMTDVQVQLGRDRTAFSRGCSEIVFSLVVFHTPLWSTDLYSLTFLLKVCLCIIQLVGERKEVNTSFFIHLFRCLVRLVLSTIETSSDEMRWGRQEKTKYFHSDAGWAEIKQTERFTFTTFTPCRDANMNVLLPYLKMGEYICMRVKLHYGWKCFNYSVMCCAS